MQLGRVCAGCVVAAAVAGGSFHNSVAENASNVAVAHQQVPSGSKDDLNFFLHGSMSMEIVPEVVLDAFVKAYPDLFPKHDLSNFGLIPDMHELLTSSGQRPKTFHRGSRVFDENEMGYTDDGSYVLDTAGSGNSNSGHDYGTKLSDNDKHDLIEYLLTL